MRVALVYDRITKWGGAERVLLTLHDIFPDAPLYTAFYDEKKTPWASVFPKIYTSFLQNIPFLKGHHELIPYFMPIAFESFKFDTYDLVISVTSESAKGIIIAPSTLHICYCLTPTRYLWSHYKEYFGSSLFQFITKPLVSYMKVWDRIAANRPDVIIGISKEVQGRIKKYYKKDCEIIYPPVEFGKFKQNLAILAPNNNKLKYRDYYLVVSRLVPYKKVDLAVKAFNKLGKPLIVIGIGSEMWKLRKLAKKNIHFTGFVTDAVLASYYKNAKALIFPQEEDFGIVSVEAQSLGTPIIAYNKGGVLDTVINGKTGILFKDQTVQSLVNAVNKFEKMLFSKSVILKNANRFVKNKFKTSLELVLRKYFN